MERIEGRFQAAGLSEGLRSLPKSSESAMLCADSVDVNDMTMENAFKGTISTSRNVSHICEFP